MVGLFANGNGSVSVAPSYYDGTSPCRDLRINFHDDIVWYRWLWRLLGNRSHTDRSRPDAPRHWPRNGNYSGSQRFAGVSDTSRHSEPSKSAHTSGARLLIRHNYHAGRNCSLCPRRHVAGRDSEPRGGKDVPEPVFDRLHCVLFFWVAFLRFEFFLCLRQRSNTPCFGSGLSCDLERRHCHSACRQRGISRELSLLRVSPFKESKHQQILRCRRGDQLVLRCSDGFLLVWRPDPVRLRHFTNWQPGCGRSMASSDGHDNCHQQRRWYRHRRMERNLSARQAFPRRRNDHGPHSAGYPGSRPALLLNRGTRRRGTEFAISQVATRLTEYQSRLPLDWAEAVCPNK